MVSFPFCGIFPERQRDEVPGHLRPPCPVVERAGAISTGPRRLFWLFEDLRGGDGGDATSPTLDPAWHLIRATLFLPILRWRVRFALLRRRRGGRHLPRPETARPKGRCVNRRPAPFPVVESRERSRRIHASGAPRTHACSFRAGR